MIKELIKISNRTGQTKVNIPKKIAEETGLNKAKMAVIESMEDKSVRIKEIYYHKVKKRNIQADQN